MTNIPSKSTVEPGDGGYPGNLGWIVAESLGPTTTVSGRIKAHELERLLPRAWQAERLATAVHV